MYIGGYPGGSVVKNLPATQERLAGDTGSIPRSGRFPWRKAWQPARVLAWRISWTEEPGGPWSVGTQRAGHG